MATNQYTDEQRENISEECVQNAVYSDLYPYGKDEDDFIQWMEDEGVSAQDAMNWDTLETRVAQYVILLESMGLYDPALDESPDTRWRPPQ